MILWEIAPPPHVKQDATFTKHVYQHSKHYVGEGDLVSRGNDVAEAKKPIMWIFVHGCVI